MAIKDKKAKKALLKQMVKGSKPAKDGASPTKLDNGLGSSPLNPGSGGGTNLGTKGVF